MSNLYSPLNTVFQKTMEREGVIATTYTGGTEFTCFFRIRNDNDSQRDTTIIYYDKSEPVKPGTLICYAGTTFLAINKETIENDVYYKSTLVKCNGLYSDNKGVVYNIPFYTDEMQSAVSVGNNIMAIINGNLELLTEYNSLSENIKINQKFNEFGRTFEVSNLYVMNGILHIIAEVTQNEPVVYDYTVVIDGCPSGVTAPNTRFQLTAATYINGELTSGAIDWTSSDTGIVTVDGDGLITCIAKGQAVITATWSEKNVSQSVDVIVANNVVEQKNTCAISGGDSVRLNRAKSWTVTFTDSAGTDVTSSVKYKWNVVSDFEVSQTIEENKIKVKVTDENYVGCKFTLQVLVNNSVVGQTEITVNPVF